MIKLKNGYNLIAEGKMKDSRVVLLERPKQGDYMIAFGYKDNETWSKAIYRIKTEEEAINKALTRWKVQLWKI